MQQLPEVDVVVSPVGVGTGAGGTATAVKALNSDVRTISVQAENAPSIHMSYLSGKPESTPTAETFADGLATRNAFQLPLGILRVHVDEFILVSEDELRAAIKLYVKHCHTIAEGAGAATLAGAIKLKEQLKGKKVVLVLSGGNLTYEELMKCLK